MSDPSDALSVLREAALAHASSLERDAEFFERYAPAMGAYASDTAAQLRGEARAICVAEVAASLTLQVVFESWGPLGRWRWRIMEGTQEHARSRLSYATEANAREDFATVTSEAQAQARV